VGNLQEFQMNNTSSWELNDNHTFFKNRFIGTKYGMSYVKFKVRRSGARDKFSSMKLRFDCGVSFVCIAILEGVNKEVGYKKVGWNIDHQTWYLGSV